MKLWIFVLLGLLAQTSHGQVSCSYESLEKSLTEKFTSAIHGCRGSSFFIPLLSLTNLRVEILDVVSVAVTVKHTGGGQFQVVISASLSTGCKGFSNTLLGVKIELTVSLGLKGGNPCHEIVKDSLKVSITTSGDTKVLDLSLGRLVGGLIGTITNLVTSLVSSLITLLTGALTNILESALKELNIELEGLTKTGGDIQCKVTNIEYGDKGVGYSIDYTLKSTGETIFSTASQVIASLQGTLDSALSLPADLIASLSKSIFPSITRSITEKERQNNIFSDILEDLEITITTPSSSHCSSSSEGAVLTVSLEVIINKGGNHFLELDLKISAGVKVRRSNGHLKIEIENPNIETVTVKFTDASCGCDDHDSLLDSIADIIQDIVDELIHALDCELEHDYFLDTSSIYGYENEDIYCPWQENGFYC